MTPYNICENKWVSNTKKIVKNHKDVYTNAYMFLIGLFVYTLIVFAILVSFKSFY